MGIHHEGAGVVSGRSIQNRLPGVTLMKNLVSENGHKEDCKELYMYRKPDKTST